MTITIEEGKFYITRDGRVVGPAEDRRSYFALDGMHYRPDGLCAYEGREHIEGRKRFDLVAEAPTPNDDHAVKTVEGEQIADTPEWAAAVEAEASEETNELPVNITFPLRFSKEGYISDPMPGEVTVKSISEAADIKAHIADEAKRIVSGARRAAYGKPESNFERIARFWDAYFKNTGRNIDVTAADVSPLMRLMKEARLCETPDHLDSHVDLVGYTLTGAEVAGVKAA